MTAPMRLSHLCELIQLTLQDQFVQQQFWVMADISNHSYYSQRGFHYFDLVETEEKTNRSRGSLIAKVSGVAWREGAVRIKAFERETGQVFGNDLQVLIQVSVDFHPVYGLKLTLLDIDARFTLGLLEQKKQATIRTLIKEYPDYVWDQDGQLQSFNQELYLPPVVQRIAVISSKTAAGYEDFLHSLDNNPFGYRFEIHPFFASVQGENNAAELAAALDLIQTRASALEQDFDAVIIIRGGGAATDLLIFDQLEVAAAIAACPFPVFTGIGHQKNETIADLVAHTSFKTPTKVAEFIIERNRGFETELLRAHQTVKQLARQVLSNEGANLQEARLAISTQAKDILHHQKQVLRDSIRQIRMQPGVCIGNRVLALQRTKQQLSAGTRQLLKTKEKDLEHLQRLLHLASPERILARGFALIKLNNAAVADASGINEGDKLEILLAGTKIDALVQQKTPCHGDPFNI